MDRLNCSSHFRGKTFKNGNENYRHYGYRIAQQEQEIIARTLSKVIASFNIDTQIAFALHAIWSLVNKSLKLWNVLMSKNDKMLIYSNIKYSRKDFSKLQEKKQATNLWNVFDFNQTDVRWRN